MTPKRPKTVSFPIGLFCDATISVPQQEDLEVLRIPSDLDEVFPALVRKDLKSGEVEDDANWNDTSA